MGGKKDFNGLGHNSGLASQGGFVGMFSGEQKESTPITTVISQDDRKNVTFSIQLNMLEKVKDFCHLKRVNGETQFTKGDAFDYIMRKGLEVIGEIPPRPEEVKLREESHKRGRKSNNT
ncbi:hypothetical protein LX64_05175 [Chitinophaga skermanii]|uniref:Uncharacterized protein n=1 Tax=Chitinophaga skermanii TaxID=331697 RepID=A0A327PXD7_9BACT|nr:hypothetical protein [Chitinophaga skermanii]RAI96995.1 hypothetical protein LX64_05175 [Chitinophaga skermanii]